MELYIALIVVAIIYGVLLFFDLFFKSCAHYPYIQFLEGTGFTIGFLNIKWTTLAFNRTLLRWGSTHSKFFNLWFTIGFYCTALLLPFAVLLLLTSVAQDLFSSKSSNATTILYTVVPGIDFPASELGYYSLTLVISSIFHELGHALAAVREDVHLINVGCSVFFILPVAFVNLNSESLMSLQPRRALKVLCAGVWHNIVLSLCAYALYCLFPFLISMFFETSLGVQITYMAKNSPLHAAKGLEVGNILMSINDCEITDEDGWFDCLNKQLVKPQVCVNEEWVHSLDESVQLKLMSEGHYDCCEGNKKDNMCFEYLAKNDGILEIPPHVCLPVRYILDNSPEFCPGDTQCSNGLHCIRPMLDKSSNVFRIGVKGRRSVIYIGLPTDLSRTIKVSPFVPKRVFSSSEFPDCLSKLLKYIVVFSFSLGVINLIPVMFMDGQYIFRFLMQLLFKGNSDAANINVVSVVVAVCGTVLLCFHCLYSLSGKLF